MARIEDVDSRRMRFQQVVRGAAIALERELDVLCGHRLTVVEDRALAQREIVAEAVLRRRPGFGETGRQQLPGHRLGQRIMQCVEYHKRGDDPRGLRRIEPGRGQRDGRGPGQLSTGCAGESLARRLQREPERGERKHVAAGHPARSGCRLHGCPPVGALVTEPCRNFRRGARRCRRSSRES